MFLRSFFVTIKKIMPSFRDDFFCFSRKRRILSLLCLFSLLWMSVGTQLTRSLELDRASDMMTSLKAGNLASHIVRFRTVRTFSSSTIVINFGSAVSDMNAIAPTDVALSYGTPDAEVGYPVGSNAANGIWGASIATSTKSVTLTYPTSNGIPIATGDSVIVQVGTDATADILQVAVAAVNGGNQVGSSSPAQVQNNAVNNGLGVEVEIAGEINLGQQIANNGQAALNNIGQIQQYIQEKLAQIRNFVDSKATERARVESQPAAQVVVSPPATSTTTVFIANERQTLSTEQDALTQKIGDTQKLLYLAKPKSITVNPAHEASLVLKRNDGGSIEIAIPQEIVVVGRTADWDIQKKVQDAGIQNDAYTIEVKPLTTTQAQQWTGLDLPSDKKIVPGHLYLITAAQDSTAIADFQNPLTYSFHYTDDELRGIDERTLALYSWNTEGALIREPSSSVDINKNVVTARVNHLTVFFLMGDSSSSDGVQSDVVVVPSVKLQREDARLDSINLGFGKDVSGATISGNDIFLAPNASLDFCINSSAFPKAIKRITAQYDSRSIPLLLNPVKHCYEARIVSKGVTGKKPLMLRIAYIDDQVQTLKFRVSQVSALQVQVLSAFTPAAEQVRIVVQEVNAQILKTVETSQPVLQTTAIATGPVATVLNPTLLSNSFNWYHYFNHFLSALLSALGLRKRRKPWGVVYDAITKSPVDLAIIRLFDSATHRLIETQVTDKNGRFSFIAPVGTYTISVTKPPYVFPSVIVKTPFDGEFSHVYHNEPLSIKSENDTLDINIPIDPPHKDLHAVEQSFSRRWRGVFQKYSQVSLVLSLVVSMVLTYYTPNRLNFILLILNCGFVLSQVFLMKRTGRSWGVVFDIESLKPVPLVAISIFNAKERKLLRTRLSDYSGRFGFLAPPGHYIVTVSKARYAFPPQRKSGIRKYHKLYFGDVFQIKRNKGYRKMNIPIEKKEVVPMAVVDEQKQTESRSSKIKSQ